MNTKNLEVVFDYDLSKKCGKLWGGKLVITNDSLKNLDYVSINLRSTERNLFYHFNAIEAYCVNKLIQQNNLYRPSMYKVIDDKAGNQLIVPNRQYYSKAFNQFEKDVCEMISLEENIDKIFFILKKEYGFIAEMISDCKHADIHILKSLDDIRTSSSFKHMDLPASYISSIHDAPAFGIVYKGLLIDGHHRYKILKNQFKTKSFPYVVIKE